MDGVGRVMSAEGATHVASGQNGLQLPSGALALSRKSVAEALGSTGFVNVTGQLQDNFETYLDRKPFEIEVGDLKPGMLADLATWVASKIEKGDRDQAQQTQERVQPERAVKLLA